jgi:Undecaprenyl-phosphate galactose phosphotransferase WbaP
LSTQQQANENPTQRTAGMRLTPRRPHLVSTTEIRAQREAVIEAGLEAETNVELSRTSFNFSETHGRNVARSRAAAAFAPTGAAATVKRLVDVIGAIILGLVFSPLIIAIVFLMRKSGGSVIYRHRRVGRGGRMFSCLKFRTMVPNAEQILRELLETNPEIRAEWVRDRKLRHDPRVTGLGHFLRRTSLDELPQLLNVLRGEMSLVGPRPVVREELLRYGRNVGTYLAAKPGITGLWQVTGRNDTDYRRRVVLDTYYVRNQNLLLDLYILAKTTGVVLGGNGAY